MEGEKTCGAGGGHRCGFALCVGQQARASAEVHSFDAVTSTRHLEHSICGATRGTSVQRDFDDPVAQRSLGSLASAFEEEHHVCKPLHALPPEEIYGHAPSIVGQALFGKRTALWRNR